MESGAPGQRPGVLADAETGSRPAGRPAEGSERRISYAPEDAETPDALLQSAICNLQSAIRYAPFRGARKLARILWQQAVFPGVAARAGADLLFAPGYVLPLCWSRPSVLFVYDVIALSHPALARRGNAWHYRVMLPRSARRATRIAVPSMHVRDQVVKHCGVPPEKVAVVPLGVDPAFHPVADPDALAAVRERYRLPERFVLYVGNLEPKKNLPRLLEAYALLRREGVAHHLVLAGEAGWGMEALRAALEASAFRADVHVTGFVPDADLPALYTLADLFVFPSVVEGFGLPPLEAMACGTPALVADAPPFDETVGDAAVRVDPHDAKAIALGMQQVLTDEALRLRLSEAGHQRAAAFTWERAARALVGLFSEARASGEW